MGGLSPSVTQRIDALPETGAVTALREFDPKVGGALKTGSAIDPATVEQNVRFDLRSGHLDQLGVHEVAVQADEAKKRHVSVGDRISLFFPETGNQAMTVVALYGTKEPIGQYTISLQAFDANVAMHVDNQVLVTNAPGVSDSRLRAAVETVLEEYPTAELMTKSEFKGSVANQIDQILNLVYVLLAMALLIALFGIANTLALSVLERTREFGLLRAVGAGRAQVRSTVRWESVLIGLLGTSLGTAIGIGFGWALMQAMKGNGLDQFTIPVLQLAVIVVVAAVAAVVAAVLPARRAAKLDVLQAISNQ